MRMIAGVCGVLVAGALSAQSPAPSARLSIGTPKSAVDTAFGQRFGRFRVEAGDNNAAIGVPPGVWDVYHLTAPPDRMYVTMVHFAALLDSNSSPLVDSLMLVPAAAARVGEILADQPAFASICKPACEEVLVTNRAGKQSLLLRPTDRRENLVLYFDGDSAGRFKSVTSMDSVVSGAYLLSRSAFEAHHAPNGDRVIGS